MQFAIADMESVLGVVAFPDNGRLLAPLSQMTVQAVGGGVQLACNTVLLTPPGHELLHGGPLKLEDLVSWPLILTAPESLLRQRVEQAFKSRGLTPDVVLALDDTESMKRYVEIGMGISVGSDFTLHAEDHHRFGVVRLDHIFPSSVIGVCTLKGKFAGQVVRSFIEMMSDEIRGFHAELWSWDGENPTTSGLGEVGSKND